MCAYRAKLNTQLRCHAEGIHGRMVFMHNCQLLYCGCGVWAAPVSLRLLVRDRMQREADAHGLLYAYGLSHASYLLRFLSSQ